MFHKNPTTNKLKKRANNYQAEESEKWLGEWMEVRGVRDQIVLATKYTSPYRTHNQSEIQANFVGNNAKSLKLSVEASLKKLRTDYIDLVRAVRSFRLNSRDILANLLLHNIALRPLVGFQHFHRGSHDLTQPASRVWEGSVPGYQRYTRVDREQGQPM